MPYSPFQFSCPAALGALAALFAPVFSSASDLMIEQPMKWEFKVFLDDKEIGTHEFRLQPDNGELVLQTEAKFDVKFFFITAFTYRHNNVERWDEQGLVSIDSYTDSNGTIYDISGQRKDGIFVLESQDGKESLPNPVMTFAYWNPEILERDRLLNSQTGEYESVDVVEKGVQSINYQGSTIDARRYDLVLEEMPISVWYAITDGRWVALESPTKSGRILRYEPVQLPESPVETISMKAHLE